MNGFAKRLGLMVSLLISCSVVAHAEGNDFSGCKGFFYNGEVPQISQGAHVPAKLKALCFSSFAVLYSGESKTPVYVVEKLNSQTLRDAKGNERTDNFYEEARLPFADRATLDDYMGSNYDRGHMAPAADMSTQEAMAQSFSLANMVPQAREHNRGLWAKSVEKPTRHYVLMRALSDVYVFTGTQFTKKPLVTIGRNRVWVPDTLYKLVYDPSARRAWAYWSQNSNDEIMQRPISYQELRLRTGINFIPGAILIN